MKNSFLDVLNATALVLCAVALAFLSATGLGLSVVAEASAQGIQVPQANPGLVSDVTQGKQLFATNCAVCHGKDLKGTFQGPPLLHRIYEPSHHGDAAFQAAAKYGSRAHHWQFGDMPPVPAVTPDEVAHIIAYVRAEQQKVGIK